MVFSRRIWDVLFAAAFLVGITLPMVIAFFPQQSTWIEDIEKRRPASFPHLSWDMTSLKKFAPDFEAFFDDKVGFRTQLIQLRNRLDFGIFRKSPTSLVVLGQGDWLFYNDKTTDEGFLGLVPFKPAELERMRHAIEQRRAWLAQRGIAYIFVIAPNKQTIYPEELSTRLQGDHGPTRTTQFMQYMRGSPAESSVIYLADNLIAAKSAGEVYYHRDTHWNYHGAYTAYRAVIDRLDRLSPPGVAPLSLTWNDISDVSEPTVPPGGDLANMLNLGAAPPSTEKFSIAHLPCYTPVPPTPIEGVTPSNEPDNAWTCAADASKQRLLMFHDSFGIGMLPFYAATFSYFRDTSRRPTFDEFVKFVDAEHPTVVIEERIERNLSAPELVPSAEP